MLHHFRKHASALENWMAPLFAKTPHLSHNVRQTLVKIAPWLALIGGVLGIATIWGTGVFTSLFAYAIFFSGGLSFVWMLALVLGFISAVLDLMAYKPLSERSKRGWDLLFYGNVISGAGLILQFLVGYGSLGSILGMLIGFWLLFEVRGMYHA